MHGSDDVRDFYERMPYPPPVASLDEERALHQNPIRRRALFHRMWPEETPRSGQTILIAGCGTSQAARHALREPDAHVTGIDVSETSLRHTRELQRQHGLHNLELHQLAIEDVGQLGRTFDRIVCTGVLHHLPDPDLGLRALRGVLRPEGAMQLMVYAPYGRTGIYMMQEYCRKLGVTASAQDLADLAATLESLPGGHPIAAVLRHARDFRQPGAMADALLHPLDRAYSVPELYAWLDRCGMAFGRWLEQAPYLPECGAVAKSPHAARLAALPPRSQHAAVELFRGTMVLHSVIAWRDDRGGAAQPIAFAGGPWPDYVPVPLPGTICVRERLPAGAAAVLINRAHTCTDLICTVDPLELRLFEAIDGERTLADIARVAAADDRERVRSCFKRLWQYDQIVFDASRARSGERI